MNIDLYRTLKKSLFIILCASVLFLSACRQAPQTPDPSLTAVGGNGSGGSSADWISPDDISRSQAMGLDLRDSSMADQDNRIENLFQPVYFDFNQSFVRPQDRAILQEVSDYLRNNPSHQLLIEGHCDWRGTTEYNMTLGDRRSGSVSTYIVQLGISPDRIETVSKGDLEAQTEASEQQMQQDRRADLIIIK